LPLAVRRANLPAIKPSFTSLIWILICLCRFHTSAALALSEFIAANSGGLSDEDGDGAEWKIHLFVRAYNEAT